MLHNNIDRQPFISVILPVYNAEKYLAESIQSVLDQTYSSFELLVIDDGSTDNSVEIGMQFAQRDARVRLVRNTSNQGLVTSLNQGFDIAQGKYIARMDADDICLPFRFEKQVEYLEAHPEIGILGCDIHYMDENGNITLIPDFSFHGDLEIRWNLYFINPFYHPTIMMRKSIIDRHNLRYDPRAEHVEDYEFWGRFLLVSKGENLNEILLHYRLHSGSISHHHGRDQANRATQISREIINLHLPDVTASPKEIKRWLETMWRVKPLERRNQAHLIMVHIKIWHAFYKLHREEMGISMLKKDVIAWSAIMILYPLFQPDWIRTIWNLTLVEWRWPLMMLAKLPHFYADRKFFSLRLDIVDTG